MPDMIVGDPPGADHGKNMYDARVAQGRALTAGTAQHPRRIEVLPLPPATPAVDPGHSSVRGFFEYVDFNRLRGNDYYLLAEGDITYRVNSWFYAVRTGFGVSGSARSNK